jgi:peptide chain release factor 2
MRSGGIFDYDRRKVRIIELQEQTQDPEFWNDPQSTGSYA